MSMDILDVRQRMIAALMLSAVDLPADLESVGAALKQATDVCPGLALADLPPLEPGGRKRNLERARQLLEQLLREAG